MRLPKRTGDEVLSAPSPTMPSETFTRVFLTVDVFLVTFLAFVFGFGNGWESARRLGVNPWIAPLIQPAVDLAVIGLMVALRYLAIHGWTDEQLRKPRWWLRAFGAMTLAMNTALPLGQHRLGLAAWSSIGPILLIAWSELGPWLLRAIYSVRTQEATAGAAEPQDQLEPAPTPTAKVVQFRKMSLVDRAQTHVEAWRSAGKSWDQRPGAAFHKELKRLAEHGVIDKAPTPRWANALVKDAWERPKRPGRSKPRRVANIVAN